MENLGMGLLIEYQDRATTGLNNTRNAFNSFNQTIDQTVEKSDKVLNSLGNLARHSAELVAGGFGLHKIGSKITSNLNGLVNEAKSYEKEMTNLKFVARASKEEMELFNRTAIKSGIETQFSPQEVVQGMYELKSAGLSNISMLKSLRATLDLVALSGGKLSMSSGSALMANMLNKFNLDPENSTRIVDVIARVTQDTNFHIEDIPSFVNSLRDAPTKLKRPMEELFALGGLLRNLGQQSAQSGQTVAGFARQVMNLSKMLENGSVGRLGAIKQKYMKQLGITKDTFWKDGKMSSMPEVFLSIVNGAKDMSEQERSIAIQAVFGDQSGAVVSAVENALKNYYTYDSNGKLVDTGNREGKQTLESLVKSLNNAQGSANEGAQDLLKTYWGIQTLMQGSIQTLQVLLGKTILPMFGRAIQLFTKFLNQMITLADTHPNLAKFLVLTTAFIGIFAKLSGSIMMIGGALGFAYLGFKSAMVGLSALKSFILPLLPLLAKFSLIAGGIYLAWKYNFLNVQTITNNLVKNFKTMFNDISVMSSMGSKDMLEMLHTIESSGGFFGNLTSALFRFISLFKLLGEAWNDNKLSEDSFIKMRELGLLPLVSVILDLKEKFESFFRGLKLGIQNASDFITDKFSSLSKLLTIDLKINGDPTMLTPLTKFLQALNLLGSDKVELLGKVAGYAVTLGVPLMLLGKILKIASSIGGAIFSVVKFVGSFGTKLWGIASVIFKIGGAVLSTIAAIAGIPVWVVAAIVAVVSASAYAIYKYWAEIKDFTSKAATSIANGFVSIYNSFTTWCSNTWGTVVTTTTNAFNTVLSFLQGIGSIILTFIVDSINSAKELILNIINAIPSFIDTMVTSVEKVIKSIPGIFSDIWDSVELRTQNFFSWFTSKFEWLSNKFQSLKTLMGFDTEPTPEDVPLPPLPTEGIEPEPTSIEGKVETIRQSYISKPTTNTSSDDNRIVLEKGAVQIIVPEGSNLDEKTVEELFEKIERKRQLKNIYGGRR